MDKDLDDLKVSLRSVAVSSPVDLDAMSLLRDYKMLYNAFVPIRKYGYSDPVKFLREMCGDCFLFQGSPRNPKLTLIVPPELEHLDHAVKKQKMRPNLMHKGRRQSVLKHQVTPAQNNAPLQADTHQDTPEPPSPPPITDISNSQFAPLESGDTSLAQPPASPAVCPPATPPRPASPAVCPPTPSQPLLALLPLQQALETSLAHTIERLLVSLRQLDLATAIIVTTTLETLALNAERAREQASDQSLLDALTPPGTPLRPASPTSAYSGVCPPAPSQPLLAPLPLPLQQALETSLARTIERLLASLRRLDLATAFCVTTTAETVVLDAKQASERGRKRASDRHSCDGHSQAGRADPAAARHPQCVPARDPQRVPARSVATDRHPMATVLPVSCMLNRLAESLRRLDWETAINLVQATIRKANRILSDRAVRDEDSQAGRADPAAARHPQCVPARDPQRVPARSVATDRHPMATVLPVSCMLNRLAESLRRLDWETAINLVQATIRKANRILSDRALRDEDSQAGRADPARAPATRDHAAPLLPPRVAARSDATAPPVAPPQVDFAASSPPPPALNISE